MRQENPKLIAALEQLKLHLEWPEQPGIAPDASKSWVDIFEQKHANEVYHFSIEPLADAPEYVVRGINGVWAQCRDLKSATEYADRVSAYTMRVHGKKFRPAISVYLSAEQRELSGIYQ